MWLKYVWILHMVAGLGGTVSSLALASGSEDDPVLATGLQVFGIFAGGILSLLADIPLTLVTVISLRTAINAVVYVVGLSTLIGNGWPFLFALMAVASFVGALDFLAFLKGRLRYRG